jgi:hypothetical protein
VLLSKPPAAIHLSEISGSLIGAKSLSKEELGSPNPASQDVILDEVRTEDEGRCVKV